MFVGSDFVACLKLVNALCMKTMKKKVNRQPTKDGRIVNIKTKKTEESIFIMEYFQSDNSEKRISEEEAEEIAWRPFYNSKASDEEG